MNIPSNPRLRPLLHAPTHLAPCCTPVLSPEYSLGGSTSCHCAKALPHRELSCARAGWRARSQERYACRAAGE